MARIMDLPDEVLTMIFSNFKPSSQWSSRVRSHSEVEPSDVPKRATLAALARVCKRFSTIAGPPLNAESYIFLDMTASEAHLAEQKLALLNKCRSLQYLVCSVRASRIDAFLVCIAGSLACAKLQGLSIRLYDDGGDPRPINLGSLSRLPTLLGLELQLMTELPLVLPPSCRLLSLKELRVCRSRTVAQTVAALSLASTSTLEVLELTGVNLEHPASANLWSQAFGYRRFHQVNKLRVQLKSNQAIPFDALRQASTYFPALGCFYILCHCASEVQCDRLLANLPSSVTDLGVSHVNEAQLKALLISITTDLKVGSKLRAIDIGIEHLSGNWESSNRSEMLQILREARQVAAAQIILLEPLDLAETLERMPA